MSVTADLERWFSAPRPRDSLWLLQRLTGTDTLAVGGRISGILVPPALLDLLSPGSTQQKRVPPMPFAARLAEGEVQNVQLQTIRALYFQKYRDESRLSGWGGARLSPLVRPESTGALVAFAFPPAAEGEPRRLDAWLSRSAEEEQWLESRFGPVDPGVPRIASISDLAQPAALPAPEQAARQAMSAASPGDSLDARLLTRHRAALTRVAIGPLCGAPRVWSDAVLAHLLEISFNEERAGAAAVITGPHAALRLRDGTVITVVASCRYRELQGTVITLQRGMDDTGLSEVHARGVRLAVPRELLPFYPARVRRMLVPLETLAGTT